MKHFSKLAFIVTIFSLCATASAAPLSFSHSGVLRENGNLVSGERNFTAVIYDKESGTEVGRLENKTINVVNGVYNLTIENIDQDLVAVSNGLELELQIGANDPMTPRFAINSVPFALSANHAKNADEAAMAKSIDCQGCIASSQLDNDIKTILDNTLPNNTKYALSSTVGGDALKAVSADLKIATTNIANGDSIQIGSGTPINIVNAKHAASADSATKATQDGSGNTIASTYLTKTDAASTYQPKGSYLTGISYNSIKGGTDTSSSHLQQGTVTGWNIKDGTIKSEDIGSGAITYKNIADNTIRGQEIQDGSITADDLAQNSVTAKQIAYNSIYGGTSTSDSMVRENSITSWNIKDSTITMADIDLSNVALPRAYAHLEPPGPNSTVALSNNKNISSVKVDGNGNYTVNISSNAKLSGKSYIIQITTNQKLMSSSTTSCGIYNIDYAKATATQIKFQTSYLNEDNIVSAGPCQYGGNTVSYTPMDIVIFQ